MPYVAVDRSMAWADGSLAARAAAEAAKLAAGLAFGWIETTANLGLELYDVVTVDGTDVRVVGIAETWDRGRLMQRLELAEVNSIWACAEAMMWVKGWEGMMELMRARRRRPRTVGCCGRRWAWCWGQWGSTCACGCTCGAAASRMWCCR